MTDTPKLGSLDAIARSVRRAQESASYAGALAAGDPERAREFALKSKEHSAAALLGLVALGVQMPGIETDSPIASAVPLELLDTPAVRRLLEFLLAATVAGSEVDRERGWIDADGESCGFGEQLAGIALGVRMDVFGPAGRD